MLVCTVAPIEFVKMDRFQFTQRSYLKYYARDADFTPIQIGFSIIQRKARGRHTSKLKIHSTCPNHVTNILPHYRGHVMTLHGLGQPPSELLLKAAICCLLWWCAITLALASIVCSRRCGQCQRHKRQVCVALRLLVLVRILHGRALDHHLLPVLHQQIHLAGVLLQELHQVGEHKVHEPV